MSSLSSYHRATWALLTSLTVASCSGVIEEPRLDEVDESDEDETDESTDGGRPANDARVPGRDATPPSGRDAGGSSSGGNYRVEKGVLYDGCGEEVVLRGVNHPTIYVDRAGKAMPEIARTGANTVRLFWFGTHGVSIDEAEASIEAALENGMLPMLELHDSTCKWELGPIVDYWTSSDAVALIKRHEKHLLLNIANEASPPDGERFKQGYRDAVARMREAGIHVPLVIDGGRCGRDAQMLLDNGADLIDDDPDHNLIFSAHLYDPLSESQLGDLFDSFKQLDLPFIIGELAHRQPPGCGSQLNYQAMLSEAERTNIGWLAWSWGDDNPATLWNTDCGEFDMTSTFSFDSLQGWGKEVALSLEGSLEKAAVRPYSLTHDDSCE